VSYLLDTNVLSELVRPRPEARVLEWFREVPDEALHVSVLTLGEIRSGIERLGSGARREKLRVWLETELSGWFEDRVLPIDAGVADRWGRLLAATGRSVPAVDGLIAATALHHELRLVTRNAADFTFPGLEVVDPWLP
jgi:predicted nucleic acid-binding protein